MNADNIIPFPLPPPNPFTREAQARWNEISRVGQEAILKNIYCGKCKGIGSIILESGNMQRRSLILRGKCKDCGREVCRVVEPENDLPR